jgi:hypothetical protein
VLLKSGGISGTPKEFFVSSKKYSRKFSTDVLSGTVNGSFQTHAVDFREASFARVVRAGPSPALTEDARSRGFSCRTGFAMTIDCRKRGWP